MSRYRIGIDPGKKGGIAIVSEDTIVLHRMPTKDQPFAKAKKVMKKDKETGRKKWTGKYKTKQMIDNRGVARIIAPYRSLIQKSTLEAVHANPHDGVVGSFEFGGTFYSIISIFEIMDIELSYVTPQVWKQKWGLIGQEKDVSRQLVLRMYPDLADSLKYKVDGGKAEALLISMM
ncbi:MAG: hypothetical protein GY861_24350 [bacterium]|nr:hypothetical protein [bacterium]